MKVTKTYSPDKSIPTDVSRTKRTGSEIVRDSRIRSTALDPEAAGFYSSAPDDRDERSAYEAASIAVWARD